MEFLRHLLLFLHLVGFAVLLGAFLAQQGQSQFRITTGMLHGALLQLVTGIALVGVRQADDLPVNDAKITVKLLVLIAIFVVVLMNRSKERVSTGVWAAVGGLTLLNAGLAVFWT
jgi:hypothetical protein